MVRFWQAIVDFFTKRKAEKPKSKTIKAEKVDGEFYFRKDILDQLENYFKVLKRMKKFDRDAYRFFSRVGCNIVPQDEAFEKFQRLEPWFVEQRPSRGGIMYTDAVDLKGMIRPAAFYFVKFSRSNAPPSLQPVNRGAVYQCTVYWDWKEKGSPTEFGAAVLPDGSVQILKVLHHDSQPIRPKKGGRPFTVPKRTWGFGGFFEDWASEHDMKCQQHLAQIFCSAANAFMLANSHMVKVKCTKDKLSGIFSVNVQRTPYFFADREKTGKKIFHMVRTHTRDLGDRQIPIRTHFRGERNFMWNGYKIGITVPGWHHGISLAELDVSAIDGETYEGTDETIGSKAFAQKLNEFEAEGVGGMYPHGRSGRVS